MDVVKISVVKKELKKLCEKYGMTYGGKGDSFGKAISEFTKNLPKAIIKSDTQLHAKWEINCDGYYPYCTNCFYEPPREAGLTDYCPKCGARMDGKGVEK